jgi:hypothetical protein
VDDELGMLEASSRVAALRTRFLTERLLNTSYKCYHLSQLAQCVTVFILHYYITNISSSSYSFVTEYSLNELYSHMRTHVKKHS